MPSEKVLLVTLAVSNVASSWASISGDCCEPVFVHDGEDARVAGLQPAVRERDQPVPVMS